jgi:hypothetical protein
MDLETQIGETCALPGWQRALRLKRSCHRDGMDFEKMLRRNEGFKFQKVRSDM